MYTVSERQQILDKIARKIQQFDSVLALVLVGSGAKGFTDLYSDLDLVAVTDDSSLDELANALGNWLAESWAPSHSKLYKHSPEIFVYCFLLPNCLNIDLGLWTEKALFARKPHWKVLFDRTGSIEDRLRDTWIPPSVASFEQVASESVSWIWQPIRSALIALKRGEYLKAEFQTGLLRQELIKLYAAKVGKTPDRLDRAQQKEVSAMYESDLATTFSNYCELLNHLPGLEQQLESVRNMFVELDRN